MRPTDNSPIGCQTPFQGGIYLLWYRFGMGTIVFEYLAKFYPLVTGTLTRLMSIKAIPIDKLPITLKTISNENLTCTKHCT